MKIEIGFSVGLNKSLTETASSDCSPGGAVNKRLAIMLMKAVRYDCNTGNIECSSLSISVQAKDTHWQSARPWLNAVIALQRTAFEADFPMVRETPQAIYIFRDPYKINAWITKMQQKSGSLQRSVGTFIVRGLESVNVDSIVLHAAGHFIARVPAGRIAVSRPTLSATQ